MLLLMTNASPPARDLGFLLRKHPDRLQRFDVPAGHAYVFYPEATDERCTAALMLDIDPIQLVRGKENSHDGGLIDAYVNDRPYAFSSFVSVAIARVFAQALGGRSDRADLVARELDLTAVLTPVRAPLELPQRLFGPLGYAVEVEPVRVSDAARSGSYVTITLHAKTTLTRLLNHIYVLAGVMDGRKHYWVGDAEVEKLFRFGADWLPSHPEREFITRRYLKRAPGLARAAVARLNEIDGTSAEDPREGAADAGETALERPMRLQERRVAAVMAELRKLAPSSVLDLGCGDGDLLMELGREPAFERITAIDVSYREIERAKERMERVPMTLAKRERLALFQSSLTYVDERLRGFDAAAVIEVIEHIDAERLPVFERILFGETRPRSIVLTTPNRDYNALFPSLAAGRMRHDDHRFEWTRDEFTAWASSVAQTYGYGVRFGSVGDVDETFGSPTQMAVFSCS